MEEALREALPGLLLGGAEREGLREGVAEAERERGAEALRERVPVALRQAAREALGLGERVA